MRYWLWLPSTLTVFDYGGLKLNLCPIHSYDATQLNSSVVTVGDNAVTSLAL